MSCQYPRASFVLAVMVVRGRGSGYSTGMKLAFELPRAQAEKLRDEATRLGLAHEELARAALADLLGTPDAEFHAAVTRILTKIIPSSPRDALARQSTSTGARRMDAFHALKRMPARSCSESSARVGP